jgi:hypothetical protein
MQKKTNYESITDRTPNAERRTPNAERQTPNAERRTPNAHRSSEQQTADSKRPPVVSKSCLQRRHLSSPYLMVQSAKTLVLSLAITT